MRLNSKVTTVRLALGFFVMAMVLVLTGCGGKHEKPNFNYMPNMVYSPANKAQESQEGLVAGMRKPVDGTVARGAAESYPFPNDPEKAGQTLRNPLPKSRQVLNRGKEMFEIYCMVCHGPYGEGNGSVVPRYPAPPSLQSDKIKGWLNAGKDGFIYHIMTVGQNRMPSYASQVPTEDRWAIIHFIRVLQRAKNPTQEDLKKLEKW